jgi:drug/metabolite transporter (DMT)-like permease
VLGFALGLAGVALLLGLSTVPITPGLLLAVAASLAAAASYGFGGVYAKGWLSGTPVLALAAGQQVAATALLIPLAVLSPGDVSPTPVAVSAAVALALASTAAGYLIYFRLLERNGPTATHTVTFLVPVFGVAWAWLLLDEPLTGGLLGAALVLLGVALVLDQRAKGTGPSRPVLGRATP